MKQLPPEAVDVDGELRQLLSLSRPRQRRHYKAMARLSDDLRRDRANRETDTEDAEFVALLAEYDSLRQESMNTVNNRVQVLILGAAAIAALVGGALTIDKPEERKLLLWALFSLVVPLTCVFVLLVWVSEAVRAHRVGSFLAGDVEARINAKLGRLVLSWEAALWTGAVPRDERWGPSMMALGAIGVVGLAAPVLGIVLTGTRWTPIWWPIVLMLPGYGLLIFAAAYVRSLMPRLRNTGAVVSVWPGED